MLADNIEFFFKKNKRVFEDKTVKWSTIIILQKNLD